MKETLGQDIKSDRGNTIATSIAVIAISGLQRQKENIANILPVADTAHEYAFPLTHVIGSSESTDLALAALEEFYGETE